MPQLIFLSIVLSIATPFIIFPIKGFIDDFFVKCGLCRSWRQSYSDLTIRSEYIRVCEDCYRDWKHWWQRIDVDKKKDSFWHQNTQRPKGPWHI